MKSKSSCNLRLPAHRTSSCSVLVAFLAALGLAPSASADTPAWLQAAAGLSLPAVTEKTDAVTLLDERIVTVRENGEIRTLVRRAFKILRPGGREHGEVVVPFDNDTRLTYLKAWCIPAQGKPFEVKEKDAVEVGISPGVLYSDNRIKVLRIPAAEPGNIIGYEVERKGRPYIFQDIWWFQDVHPVRQARLTLQLPTGWEYKVSWVNWPAQQPAAVGANQWLWEVNNIPAVEDEPAMPPPAAIEGRLTLIFFPREPSARQKTYDSWRDLGTWYHQLASGRRESSPEIREKVAALTFSASTQLDKVRALAAFAQRDIRYVAIEIGIGGYQPHAAQEVFSNRYGDCKDKATMLSTMLKELGIDSYYVLIHTRRGVVNPAHPPSLSFNHAILAIRLPDGAPAEGLHAVASVPRLGRLLFFDPTDPITPLGYLPSYLQANFGLLVTPEGGELVQLPLLPSSANLLQRSARFTLSPTGTLSGEVQEVRSGEPATNRRAQLLEAQSLDRTKIMERFLANFMGGFVLTRANVTNLEKYDERLILTYGFVVENYAKTAGNLLLVRPRVLGAKGSDLLEIKERKYPVEFSAAELHSDSFEFTLPGGYEVDELPPPVDVDYSFAAYRSKVEVTGNVLRYTRSYQLKDVFVPATRLDELKKFYRHIAADERTTAVLRRVAR